MAGEPVNAKVQKIDNVDGRLTVNFKSRDTILHKNEAVEKAVEMLNDGKIIAIKSMGGYHLAVDARREDAVSRLREKKHRYGKPLAVMMQNVDEVEKYCLVNDFEKDILESHRAPIVLLKKKAGGDPLAFSLTTGLNTVGVMLPYTPIHHILMNKVDFPLVMTSGNISDEPICRDEREAQSRLKNVADGFLHHNRPIVNRIDDSVCFYTAGGMRIVRRARGFAQEPIIVERGTTHILACGAFYKNTFCLMEGQHAFVSHHIGDLDNLLTFRYYKEEIKKHKKLFKVNPNYVVKDLHPLYPSSLYADEQGVPILAVQHHHAHTASVMAEYDLEETVIGIVYDGTGLGSDGNVWGAEFLLADLKEFQRVGHLNYVPLPGGDKAVKNLFRTALGFIYPNMECFSEYTARLDRLQVEIILKQIERKINTPLASSMGRLFDAVASLINLRDSVDYEGQAAMELESIICFSKDYYNYDIKEQPSGFCIKVHKLLTELYYDYITGVNKGIISAKFHNTVIKFTVDMAKKIRDVYGVNKTVLSGGCFQNRYLLESINEKLRREGFETYIPSKIPVNDGGISLGQAAVAAAYFSEKEGRG
ncbi:MAG: carbamoyltransferase HypF [Tepidanaerobacteraceae bacterium]